jgi:DNA-binding NtrC family response regulator
MPNLHHLVIAQHDATVAQSLTANLDRHFRSVRLARSLEELKHALPRYRAQVAVVDLETIPLDEVAQLAREFDVRIICTHRVPDEDMWTAALGAGALDVCSNDDVNGILSAVHIMSRAQAA